MSLLKDKLQKSAGLLNSEAPKDHFLAYITAEEKDMLVAAGGKETPTPSGVNAYPYWDDGSGQSKSQYDAGGGTDHQGNTNDGGNNNSGGDQEDDVATMESNMGVHSNYGPTGWSGDSATDSWESDHQDSMLGTPDYQGTHFRGGTYATADKPASWTIAYGNDAAKEDVGRPDITYYSPSGTTLGDHKSKYELNQIKHIQDTKLDSVKSKLRKNGYDIPKDANFAETKAFINDLSNDELPDSYKDLKDKNGNPLYEQSTIDKWEELGYIPEGGSMTLPGLGGAILNKMDKPLTRDELWADLDAATEVGKSGGGAMDWQERMKTYSPNQYATMTGMDYNPLTKEFTNRDGGGNEQDAVTRVAAPYQVGTTQPVESQAAKWYASLGNNNNNNAFGFSFQKEYEAAKLKQKGILGTSSSVGQLAVSNSPFYNFLKERNLDKGIL
tara:strand:+ start:343 stop:1665 length:1323 start_codon:yes stop_codon:yes gene_type:complete